MIDLENRFINEATLYMGQIMKKPQEEIVNMFDKIRVQMVDVSNIQTQYRSNERAYIKIMLKPEHSDQFLFFRKYMRECFPLEDVKVHKLSY
tara:strand:+ start:278 stop:553 length:276 start_codon:yes stop_codon:yes gene_type:complete